MSTSNAPTGGSPILTHGAVQALRAALADLLAGYETDPIRDSRLRAAWNAVALAFGGERNTFALGNLIRQSSALSSPARDALAEVVDKASRLSLLIWDDGPDGMTEADHAARVAKHQPDVRPVREARQAIRDALDALAAPPNAATPTGTQQGEGEKPKPDATTEAIPPALLSASDIAARINRKRESVTSFLTRFAEKFPDCRVENPSKRKNEPGYLYRTADVWPALEKWMKGNGEG